LKDLLLRFGSGQAYADALTMSIARFAIRNVISDDGVQFLLRLIKPAESASWQTVYALQRIGNHRLLRTALNEILLLDKHPDPFVRMNLATLLGKINIEEGSLHSLRTLALFDTDWRVRVNALRALGNFKLRHSEESDDLFRRSFFDQNPYIAITAVAGFGHTGAAANEGRSAIEALRTIAKNESGGYPWQLQGEAATALAKLRGKEAISFLRPSGGSLPLLAAMLLRALGESGSTDALEPLLEYARKSEPVLACAALDGLLTLCAKTRKESTLLNRAYEASVVDLGVHDVAVIATAASNLGDSLLLRPASVRPLIELLPTLRIPDEVEAIQEVIATLGKLRDVRAVPILETQLSTPDRSVALGAASALQSITGKDYSSSVPRSIEPSWTDFDFGYLNSLRDSACVHRFRQDTVCVKLETIRGDIIIELYKNYAPFTVMAFLKLATQRGFYRGLSFHRVVPNFVVQGGDPRGDGWGGPGFSIRSEFSPVTFETGTLGIASAGKDTEGSQFFITQSPQPHLDGRYTVFGKVVSGMDVVDKLQVDDHIFDVKLLN
jgi:cyclophilin family peptidyl-prolyl cis-trans isomerase/HEAT repeat protein